MKWSELKELIEKRIEEEGLIDPNITYDDGGRIVNVENISIEKDGDMLLL